MKISTWEVFLNQTRWILKSEIVGFEFFTIAPMHAHANTEEIKNGAEHTSSIFRNKMQ